MAFNYFKCSTGISSYKVYADKSSTTRLYTITNTIYDDDVSTYNQDGYIDYSSITPASGYGAPYIIHIYKDSSESTYDNSWTLTSDGDRCVNNKSWDRYVYITATKLVSTTYAIGYHANGGSGAPGDQKKTTTDTSYTFTLSSTTPTCSGYTFLGWSTSSSATSPTYYAGGTLTLYSSSPTVTLYAVWGLQYTYALGYNANGGSDAPGDQKYTTTDTSHSFTVSNTKPTRSGYNFLGWSTSSSATSASYSGGDTITLYSSSTTKTLYAVWAQATTQYTLTLTKGTGCSSVSGGGTYDAGTTVTISATVSSGYTWAYWQHEGGGVFEYEQSYTFQPLDDNYSLVGVCTPNSNTYVLGYSANGGNGAPGDQRAASTAASYTFTISTTTPTRSGYNFLGWSTNSSATIPSYYGGDSFTIYSSSPTRTLYAVWGQQTTYALGYSANGGSGAPGDQRVTTYNSSYSFTVSSTVPTRTGYTFLGWHEDSSATSPAYYGGETITLYSSSPVKTLYAVWAQQYTYALGYDATGGTGAPDTQFYGPTLNTSHPFTIPTKEPTKTDYSFAGWATTEGGSAAYWPGDIFTVYSGSPAITLHAVWAPLYNYIIHYDSDGGTTFGDTEYIDNPTTEITVQMYVKSNQPTQEGYTFEYWEDTVTSEQYDSGAEIIINANRPEVTLKAIWKANTAYVYKLNYNCNGGKVSQSSSDTIKQVSSPSTEQTVYAFSIANFTPYRANYTFQGWTLTQCEPGAEYSGTLYKYGSNPSTFPAMTISESPLTVYAYWTKNTESTYALTYDFQGGTYSSQSAITETQTGNATFTINTAIQPTPSDSTNYKFIGWATTAGTNVANVSSTYTITDGTTATIYAAYEIIASTKYTYAITYSKNTDDTVESMPENYNSGATATSTATLTIDSTEPTRTGYNFNTWVDDNGNSHARGSTVTLTGIANGTKTLNLKAQWVGSSIDYTLTYNCNGGTIVIGSSTFNVYTTDPVSDSSGSHAFTILTETPTQTGYTFNGWSLTSTDTSGMYGGTSGTTTITVPSSQATTTTLYATWKPVDESETVKLYTLTYNANGGYKTDDVSTEIWNVSSGETTAVSYLFSNLAGATRVNYSLLGWSNSLSRANNGDVDYVVGSATTGVTLTKDNPTTTIYACWAALPRTIVYNNAGGTTTPTGGSCNVGDTFVTADAIKKTTTIQSVAITTNFDNNASSNAIVAVNSTKVLTTSYAFNTWSDGTNNYAAKETVTMPAGSGNYTLTATWLDTNTTTYGTIKLLTESQITPVTGKYLLGWSTSQSATTPDKDLSPGVEYEPHDSGTLYAVWSDVKPNEFSIEYNFNGGVIGTETIYTAGPMKTLDSYYLFTITNLKPTRLGYTFVGWSTSQSTSSSSDDIIKPGFYPYTVRQTKLTLYAVWKVAGDYLTFNSNINVASAKVIRDISSDAEEIFANYEDFDTDTILYTSYYKAQVNADYLSSDASDYDMDYYIYKKTPSQQYYNYIGKISDNAFNLLDYNILSNEYYHYLISTTTFNYITGDSSDEYEYYFVYNNYENIDTDNELYYEHTKFNNWSIVDIEPTTEDNIYQKTGYAWTLGAGLNVGTNTQNLGISTWDTLGQYGRISYGQKNYVGSTFSSLLGSIKEYKDYTFPEYSTLSDGTYKDKEDYTERLEVYSENDSSWKIRDPYSREVEKLEEWKAFCSDGNLKLLRDMKGNGWVIQITASPTYEINNISNIFQTQISFTWQEVLDINSISIIGPDIDESNQK